MNNFGFPQNLQKITDENGNILRPWYLLFFNFFQAFNNGALSNPIGWTPSDASGAALAFSSISANWTRVGNLVHAYASWVYPATGDGKAALFGGLPSPVANAEYARNGVIFNTTASGVRSCLLTANASTGAFLSAVLAPVTNAQMSGATVRIMAIYPLA